MRVISFQSKEVIDIVLSGAIYVPDIQKCRERSSYLEDGGPKVWVFDPTGSAEYSDITDGKLFRRCCNEMSMDEDEFLKLYMFELEINDNSLTVGKYHNSCAWAYVTPTLSVRQVVSVFKLEPTRFWFYVNARRVYLSTVLQSIYPDYVDTFSPNVS